MANLKVWKNEASQLEQLWRQAADLGTIHVWQNRFNGMYHVDVIFYIGASEIEAKGREFQLIEQALDDAINVAINLGAGRDDARNRKRGL